MAAGVANFIIDQNATFIQTLDWTDASGNPIDLTSWTAKMSIGNAAPPKTVYLTLSSTGMSPGIVLGDALGTITITIPEATVASFTFLNAVYDLLLTAPDNNITRLIQGNIQVSPGVTTP